MRDHWTDDALCKGKQTMIFFPAYTHSLDRWLVPKSFCANCTVQIECLNLVLHLEDTDDRWGMFGGLTPEQRRDVRKKHRAKL